MMGSVGAAAAAAVMGQGDEGWNDDRRLRPVGFIVRGSRGTVGLDSVRGSRGTVGLADVRGSRGVGLADVIITGTLPATAAAADG